MAKTAKKVSISKNTKILDLLTAYPKAANILLHDYGLHCVGCPFKQLETLQQGAAVHGIKGKKLEKLISALQKDLK